MYKPIQLIDKNKPNSNIFYNEYSPSAELSEYVACYWILKNNNYISNGIGHRILPDGCVDIIFDLVNKNSIIAGTMNRMEEIILQGNIKNIGIRFLPKAISFILKSNANELLNNIVQTDLVCGELRDMIKKVLDIEKENGIYEVIDKELKNYFRKYNGNIKFVKILEMVMKNNGLIRVNEISEKSGISDRQISRYFSILRFQNILGHIQNRKNLSKEYLDFGFYDQAHMINELKKYLKILKMSEFYNL